MYKKRTPPEKPPCQTCRVETHQKNVDAIRIFLIVRDQYIMAQHGPVTISQVAIHKAMELYNIKNKKACFEKVMYLISWWMEKQRES